MSSNSPYKKKFIIPIYGCKVRLIVAEAIADIIVSVANDEKLEDHKETRAWTQMEWPNAWIVFREADLNYSSLGHEIDHLTHFIMREIGVTEDDKSDEAYAYMNGYLHDKIMTIINKDWKLEPK